MSDLVSYRLTVNGQDRTVADGRLGESLLYVLRERLGLAGAKNACEQGECGSCSVMVDDELVCSCLVLAASAEGQDIRTIESLAPEGELSDVQRAFVDAGAVQCGFCTPGLIVAVHDLLDRQPDATDIEVREALSGKSLSLHRIRRILEAVRLAAAGRLSDGSER